ncbi:recombinase family protein [Desulfonatronospira sp.]|uniref:recombinase family protein n=1 Tax=Desulfonatronospira sp. TaxID=1962951 RepID=UPI0025BD0C8D|nr:recombinase family protein [Desulfonatronospira sp.]
MDGIKIGYKRVSTVDQNPERQLAGLEVDKLFEDKVSGSSRERPQLQACLDYLREGDTLVVHSIDRLARNLSDLLSILQGLLDKQVSVKFIKENLNFEAGAHDNPFQKLQLQIIGSVAEFERALIRERQREGIEKAKQKGKHLGRPKKITCEMKDKIFEMLEDGLHQTEVARRLNISRQAVYRALKAA